MLSDKGSLSFGDSGLNEVKQLAFFTQDSQKL